VIARHQKPCGNLFMRKAKPSEAFIRYGIRSNRIIKTKRTAAEDKPVDNSESTSASLNSHEPSKSKAGDMGQE